MNALTEHVQILRDAGIPFADDRALISDKRKTESAIPLEAVDLTLKNDCSAARAWRDYQGAKSQKARWCVSEAISERDFLDSSLNPRLLCVYLRPSCFI